MRPRRCAPAPTWIIRRPAFQRDRWKNPLLALSSRILPYFDEAHEVHPSKVIASREGCP